MTEDDGIHQLLRVARTIAIVGISRKTWRASHEVAAFLQGAGYRIVPINPHEAGTHILNELCYATLEEFWKATGKHIDIVDCFRNANDIPQIVEDAIAAKAGCVWMQLGIANEEAKATAEAAGLQVVMNRCTKIEYRALSLYLVAP